MEDLPGGPLHRAVGQAHPLEGHHRLLPGRAGAGQGPGAVVQGGEGRLPLLHGGGQGGQGGQLPRRPHPVGRPGDLGREDVAGLQLLHPPQGLVGGEHPLHLAVLHEHHVAAVVGDVLRVVLDDDDGLAIGLVELPEHPVDPVGVHGVQLGDGLIQDEDVRLEGHRPRQGQQVGLASGELPDVLPLPALQAALLQGGPPPVQVVGEGVVQAGVGGVVQHRGADDLVFKVLVDVAHLLGQQAHVALQGVQPAHLHPAGKVPGDEVGDEAVEGLAQSGLPAAVVANDCQEVPLWDSQCDLPQRRLGSAGVGVGQLVDLDGVHLSPPRPACRRSS